MSHALTSLAPEASAPCRGRALLPGLGLTAVVAGVAALLGRAETALFGMQWLDPLVLAILLGASVRTVWGLPVWAQAGSDFAARRVLELAIVLLGASVSARTLLSVGPDLLAGIVALVALAVPGAFLLGRMLRLPWRMALLIACGNGICGNSAIAAVAPVIGARREDVSAAIAFTAVLGVAVVLGLPLVGHMAGLGEVDYGILSGLTVYAVPQVLPAAAPLGAAAVQIGTLVKLVRVVMLGPVCLVLSMLPGGRGAAPAGSMVSRLFPPLFILGFLAMAGLRSAGAIPAAALPPLEQGASALTLLAMAGLGLGVDARAVLAAGPRVVAAVVLSLSGLILLALALIALL